MAKKIEYLVNNKWRPNEKERAIVKRNLEKALVDSRILREYFKKKNVDPNAIEKDNPLFPHAQLAIRVELAEKIMEEFDDYGDDEVRLFAYSMYALEIPCCRDKNLEDLYDQETVDIMSRMFNKVNPDEVELEYLLWSGELMYQLASCQFGNDVIY